MSRQLWSIQSYRVLPTDALGAWGWSGLAHDYDNPQSARLWNLLRMLRLYLNKWVCRAYKKAVFAQQQQEEGMLLAIDPEFHHVPETAVANTVSMAEDILSSVTYFYNLILSLDASSSSLSSTVRWLIWPLSVVAVSPLSPVSMQIHARDCLRKLGEEMGSAQAVEIANMLENSETLEDWYASHPRWSLIKRLSSDALVIGYIYIICPDTDIHCKSISVMRRLKDKHKQQSNTEPSAQHRSQS